MREDARVGACGWRAGADGKSVGRERERDGVASGCCLQVCWDNRGLQRETPTQSPFLQVARKCERGFGHVGTSARGHFCTWALLHVGTSACGHFCTWALLHVGASARGRFCTWALLHVGASARGHFGAGATGDVTAWWMHSRQFRCGAVWSAGEEDCPRAIATLQEGYWSSRGGISRSGRAVQVTAEGDILQQLVPSVLRGGAGAVGCFEQR
ncbi:unnamed protein product [Closterium sp. Yama58-4]|nr:unnamed protein product [Closterium sp. Yama58-4]